MSPLKYRWWGDESKAAEWLAEAKRLLWTLKNRMKLGNLPSLWDKRFYKNGTQIGVSSIYERDFIDIVAPLLLPITKEEVVEEAIIYLVFLAKDSEHYSVWKITKNGVELTPYNFNITNDNVMSFYSPDEKVNPSTCLSNYTFDKHTVIIETEYANRYYTDYIEYSGYGKLAMVTNPYSGSSPEVYVFKGTDGCYVSPTYNDGKTIDFETYKHWETLASNIYLAGSRYHYMEDDVNSWIKQLSDRVDGTGKKLPTFKVDNESGWSYGTEFTINKQDFFAALSHDKIIGIPSPDAVYHGWQGIEWACPDSPDGIPGHEKSTGTERIAGWCFGSVKLEQGFNGVYNYSYRGCQSCSPCELYPYAICTYYTHAINAFRTLFFYDYDNLNIDETFICFYGRCENGWERNCECVAAPWGDGWNNGYSVTGKVLEYVLAYRINNGTLVKENLGVMISGAWGNYSDDADCTHAATVTSGNGTYGQRLCKFSCKIMVGKYIIYTYVIQNFTGNSNDGQDHMDDRDDTNYTFNSRILGVIDIETGTHTKYTVNDAFLGDYSSTFNKEVAAAIGIHKIVKEVT